MTAPLYTTRTCGDLAGTLDGDTSGPQTFYTRQPHRTRRRGHPRILVGHAHYDHLMDVPFFMDRAPQATVYGSTSTRNVLAGYGSLYAGRSMPSTSRAATRVEFAQLHGARPGPGCGTGPVDQANG